MENNPKSQVVERLREAQNVLVTVSNNPSVDQLSAAIGFTLMMNKLGKHATAVFSGAIPSTIEFLKPEDTLEQNTDSLRDFIISLDKAKADKLRYKVEEDVVRIFITPYKTSLSQADLEFSQGDFNVDVVIALGVDQREHIDQAIMSHGRILHDATVIGVMAGQAQIDVGSINWQEPSASSLCEMLVSISEAFQSGLLDGQMATAYLTGIVAETERFSNEKTTPKVMTMSAQLMAAGANQQLIATKLSIPTEVDDGVPANLPSPNPEPVADDGTEGVLSLHESHIAENTPAEPEQEPVADDEPKPDDHQIHIDEHGKLQTTEELAKTVSDVQAAAADPNAETEVSKYSGYMTEPPQMGGTLTASANDSETADPRTDPLGTIPESPDPLGAIPQASYPESYLQAKSTQSPLLSVQDDAESVKATEIPTTESLQLGGDGESNPDMHLGPEVTDDKTLTEIESAVEEYTGEEVHHDESTQSQAQDAEAARQAVLDAMAASGGYDENRPTPLEALGAQPLSSPEDLHGNNDGAPPAVPPPFPIPEDDTMLPPPPPPYAG